MYLRSFYHPRYNGSKGIEEASHSEGMLVDVLKVSEFCLVQFLVNL